jgi:hypothetical protein
MHALPVTSSTAIPAADHSAFAALPADEQDRITKLLGIVGRLAEYKSVKRWADAMVIVTGFSSQHLRRQADRFNRLGWRGLANGAKFPALIGSPAAAAPVRYAPEFIEYWLRLAGQHQRNTAAAYRAFAASFRHGTAIPGVGTWRDVWTAIKPEFAQLHRCPAQLPAAFARRAMMKLLTTRKAELALMRQGTAAAREILPQVHGTREGARPLEYVFFDDMWFDFKVVYPGLREAVRPLAFTSIDLASAIMPVYGWRPEIPRADGSRERLSKRDVKWLIGLLLERYGWPTDYPMHLCVENGTATIDRADAEMLYTLSGGMIRVCYAGIDGSLVLGHNERGVGNFKFKALLESTHNLIHNEMQALPGQVGRNPDNSPSTLAAKEREARLLINLATLLPPQVAAELLAKTPFISWTDFERGAAAMIQRIENRTEHNCEAFDQIPMWKLPGTVMDYLPMCELTKLPEDVRDIAEVKHFKESPRMRFNRLTANVAFTKIPAAILPRFFADCHRPVKVGKSGFEIAFEYKGKTYLFRPAAPEHAIPEGTELMATWSPASMDVIHLTTRVADDQPGQYVTTWARVKAVRRGDTDALQAALRDKHRVYSSVLANVNRANRDDIVDRLAAMDQNLDLIRNGNLSSLSASSKSHTDAGTAGNGSPSEPENTDHESRITDHVSPCVDGAQARPLSHDAGSSPASSAPHQPAQPPLSLGSGADEDVPALTTAPRLTATPSLSNAAARISDATARHQRALANDLSEADARAARQRARIAKLSQSLDDY